MPSYLTLFLVGFIVSFFGSIPPGIINLTVMQFGIRNLIKDALQFILGVAFVEFFYALAAVRFSVLIKNHNFIGAHLNLLAAVVLVAFGISNFISGRKKENKLEEAGRISTPLLKGALVSLLNPLAITFWLGVTTYLVSIDLITFSDYNDMFYLAGIVVGTIVLLVLVAFLSRKFQQLRNNNLIVYYLPGMVFFLMGGYSFLVWYSTL